MPKDVENAKFESVVDKLRDVIELIENNEGNIEASLKGYEEGVELLRQAQKYLADAEQKVSVLSKELLDKGNESAE